MTIVDLIKSIFLDQRPKPSLPDTIEELDAEWHRSFNGWQTCVKEARRSAIERKIEQIMCDLLAGKVVECQAALGELKKSMHTATTPTDGRVIWYAQENVPGETVIH